MAVCEFSTLPTTPALALAPIERSCYNKSVKLYLFCLRPAATHHAWETRPTAVPDPHLPTPAAHAGRPIPAPQITYNHREGSPTTKPAPTSALHLSLHSRQPGCPTCIAMLHLPILPPCAPPSAPFAAKGATCPPAPFFAFPRNKNPKYNHRHRGHQAAQSTCSTTTWHSCGPRVHLIHHPKRKVQRESEIAPTPKSCAKIDKIS